MNGWWDVDVGCAVQVEKLIDDGYDVRGYFYWTLVDNFEVSIAPAACLPTHM